MSCVTWMLLSVVGAADSLPERFDFQFSSGLENQPLLKLFGPSARQVARTDARGLRITLPSQRPRQAPVGVEPHFRLRGDFEVTLSYELLAAEPPPAPNGAGVLLLLRLDSPTPLTVTVTRLRKGASQGKPNKDTLGANVITPVPDGKDKQSTKTIPADSTQGQLRLVRSAGILRFLASDGPDEAFQEIRTYSIGTEDVKTLRAQCTTGGKLGSVDARLIALNVRAEQLPNQTANLTAETSGKVKWLWLGLIGCFLLGAAVSFFWLVRRRHASGTSPSTGPS